VKAVDSLCRSFFVAHVSFWFLLIEETPDLAWLRQPDELQEILAPQHIKPLAWSSKLDSQPQKRMSDIGSRAEHPLFWLQRKLVELGLHL
jgi:hypothetical protein